MLFLCIFILTVIVLLRKYKDVKIKFSYMVYLFSVFLGALLSVYYFILNDIFTWFTNNDYSAIYDTMGYMQGFSVGLIIVTFAVGLILLLISVQKGRK